MRVDIMKENIRLNYIFLKCFTFILYLLYSGKNWHLVQDIEDNGKTKVLIHNHSTTLEFSYMYQYHVIFLYVSVSRYVQ